jgi:hypothetical protein
MAIRTTIVLDEATREAAKQLATAYGCSMSDAIRRAIVLQRDRIAGLSEQRRRLRSDALRKLIELTEGNDPAAEVARLKEQDRFG